MHYFIIITIIVIIVIIQFLSFTDTKRKIGDFFKIFPLKGDGCRLQKEALIAKICTEKESEIAKVEKRNGQEIGVISKEINKIKSADNEKLKSKLNTVEITEYLNIDGNFRPYQVEIARTALIARLSEEIANVNRKYNNQITTIKREMNDAISKVSNEAGISVSHDNSIFKIIVNSINDYLKNNKTVSDFHLMKDIVDRNCDAKEDEISTQIPIPLYMGLVGTMAGILVGVGFLAFGGGLSALLSSDIPQWFKNTFPSSTTEEIIKQAWTTKSSEGVIALMGGVAIAMASSILGIVLTTLSSNKFKTIKSQVENHKHAFLSWIQKELLPTLSDNVVGAIREMTGNLENFNKEFAENTGNLGTALAKVNDSYKLQVQLLESVNKIADKDLTHQNLQLYTALQNSTNEIGILAQYLNNTTQYLANVNLLNEKLDNYENRTQFIENASKFYAKHENWLTENIEMANRSMQDSVEKYDKSVSDTLGRIQENLEIQMRKFADIIQKQQEKLGEKTKEIDKVVDELKNLSAIKDGISKFENATKEQNKKIDRLTESIEKLAQVKSNGGVVQQKMPRMMKIAIIAGCSIISLAGLSYLIMQIANWICELIK